MPLMPLIMIYSILHFSGQFLFLHTANADYEAPCKWAAQTGALGPVGAIDKKVRYSNFNY